MRGHTVKFEIYSLAVWVSPCLLIAIAGVEICIAEYTVLCIYNRMKWLKNSSEDFAFC